MTSRRQQSQDHYDHILPFIQEAAEEYYGGNLNRGFRHWAFATVFGVGHDIQGNDIVDYTAIDGSDDFEIDGYFIPESDDETVVHLFQSKHRQAGTRMGVGELAKFLEAPYRILNANEVAASHNEETKTLHDRLIEMLKTSNGKCTINLVWATSGTLTAPARKNAEESRSRVIPTTIGGSTLEVTVTFVAWDLSDLQQQHDDQQESSDIVARCDHTFNLEPGSYHQTQFGAEYPTLSMTVSVKEIIDVFARHKFKIFRENPRGPLGNKVNNGIKTTLLDETERKRFHLLNNGIAAICLSWSINGNKLHVQDFQIINGCQTTVTLWNARAAIQGDPGVLVSVKLTECPSHFGRTIASTTNTQTALRAEDFISNEPVQERIKREFAGMNPPWFYQIKRGEWDRMLGGLPAKEVYRQPAGGYRRLDTKEVAQAVLAFAGFPGEAKDRIRDFLSKQPVPSIAREGEIKYDGVYSDTVSAAQLLLPSVIHRKVRQQVSLEKENTDWLEYARFHIVWLIGDFLREHYRLDDILFSPSRASAIVAQIDDWFVSTYNIAFAAIRTSIDPIRQDETYRGHREFFRTPTNYRTIETNLHNAVRLASNFGDPAANLPP